MNSFDDYKNVKSESINDNYSFIPVSVSNLFLYFALVTRY